MTPPGNPGNVDLGALSVGCGVMQSASTWNVVRGL